MPDYRIYSLNSSNKIATAVDIEARDDDHAALIADELSGIAPVEIWRGTRLLGRYERERKTEGIEAAAMSVAVQRRYKRR